MPGAPLFRRQLLAAPADNEPARAPVLGGMVWRPSLRSRHGVYFVTCRAWAAASKASDLRAMRAFKAAPAPEIVERIAEEIALMGAALSGGMARSVVPIACGHSRRPDCLSAQLAGAVAARLGVELVGVFAGRFCSGSSHPKENTKLPPLEIRRLPDGPALVVDDIATSGWHMHEALTALRARGVPALGIAWVGGIKAG